MLSRIGLVFGRTAQTCRCSRYNHSSGPKLHNLLEYWHKVKTGVVTKEAAYEQSKEYWDQVRHDQAKRSMSKAKPKEEIRSWNIDVGVMNIMRKAFNDNNRDCDTVFENTDDLMPHLNEFKTVLITCYDEHDFRTLEHEVASNVASYNLRDLVYIMDGFLCHKYKPRLLLSRALKHLAYHFKDEEKTPSQVLHLMYIIGCSRDVPRELSGALEDYVRENRYSYKLSDFVVVSFAFMVTNEPITDFVLLDYIAEVTKKHFTSRAMNYVTFTWLVSIFKCFYKSRYSDVDFYMTLGDCIVEGKDRLPKIRGPQFNTLVHAYGTAGIKHDQLFKVLQEKTEIQEILREAKTTPGLTKTRGFRNKDLNRFLFACFSLKIPVDDVWVKAQLKFLNDPDVIKRYPHSFVEALITLSTIDVTPTHLYHRFYEPDVLRALKAAVEDGTSKFYYAVLFHQYIKIMLPDFPVSKEFERIFQERRTFAQKLEVSLLIKKGLLHMWYYLENVLGKERVTLEYLIQASGTVDIVLHLDENNRPIVRENQYDQETEKVVSSLRNNLNEHIEWDSENSIILTLLSETEEKQHGRGCLSNSYIPTVEPQKQRKICIRVLSYKQCFRNFPDTRGYVSMENKLVSKMGYDIYLVSPKEAHKLKCMREVEGEEYVRNLLETLNVNTDQIPYTGATEKSCLEETTSS